MKTPTWNYRVVDHGTHFALHEVYYTDGVPTSWTTEPVTFVCDPEDGATGVQESLAMAAKSAIEHPVLLAADLPG